MQRVTIGDTLLWDRKTEGGFPESKQLKQLVRDQIAPQKDLGHSDSKGDDGGKPDNDCVECQEKDSSTPPSPPSSQSATPIPPESEPAKSLSSITISYCTRSKWLMRSAWLCQEVLSEFYEDLHSITLSPIREQGQFVSCVFSPLSFLFRRCAMFELQKSHIWLFDPTMVSSPPRTGH